MGYKKSNLILIVIHSRFEFTNANCTTVDRKFGECDYIFLKSANLVLMKRFNGYKPFLYNITINACKFFANTKSSPVVKFFYESVMTFSNMNHSCPYNSHSRFEFTNADCTTLDRKFGECDYIYLKSVNRTYKYLSAKFKLYQLPRFNGYKPFLYNITINACKFFANTKSNPVVKFFYESVMTFSNMNHSCPYNHDIIVDKLPVDFINYRLTKVLPFPEGDYLCEAHWFRSGSRFAVVRIYGTLS
ncbi:uncharacterized protein [Drosophila pseudoobscura]|uniref:Uncharacterized protein n=1 Tax=Drosophila pseudoobscura pseudoobscura TaxID=46245 RepID=A0A6I8VPI4_DROPS|nr:uncharacterized protein LOC6896675 [Drosophila pseudoobscura]